METPETETNMKPKKKKTGLIVLSVIVGVLLLAAVLIFLFWPNIKVMFLVQKLKKAEIGDSFTLGTYEQDGKPDTDAEDIEWLVLAKEEDRVLVISKYALDCVQYNSEFASSSWETCTLRPWLNEDFYGNAFSDIEKRIIAITTVSADKNPMFGTDPGKDTQDPMFLLSVSEAQTYGTDRKLLQCEPTEYALRKNIDYDMESGMCKWWLRSPGLNPSDATAVGTKGYIYGQGNYVFFKFYGVRPAMWIDISK